MNLLKSPWPQKLPGGPLRAAGLLLTPTTHSPPPTRSTSAHAIASRTCMQHSCPPLRSSDPSCPAQRLFGPQLCSTHPRGSQPPQREIRSPPGLQPCSGLDSPLPRAGLSLLHAPCTSGLGAAAVQTHWPLGTLPLRLLLRSSLPATSPGLTGPLQLPASMPLHPQPYLGYRSPQEMHVA